VKAAATMGVAILLYVGSDGPVRAHEAHRLIPLRKSSEDPRDSGEILFDTFYAPLQWPCVPMPVRSTLNRYTYFAYEAIYRHPAETLFL